METTERKKKEEGKMRKEKKMRSKNGDGKKGKG